MARKVLHEEPCRPAFGIRLSPAKRDPRRVDPTIGHRSSDRTDPCLAATAYLCGAPFPAAKPSQAPAGDKGGRAGSTLRVPGMRVALQLKTVRGFTLPIFLAGVSFLPASQGCRAGS